MLRRPLEVTAILVGPSLARADGFTWSARVTPLPNDRFWPVSAGRDSLIAGLFCGGGIRPFFGQKQTVPASRSTQSFSFIGGKMQFTEDEMRMVRWLRGQHANWRGVRTIIVICSSILAVYGVWLAIREGFTFESAFYLVAAGVGFSYTLGSWSGRAEVSLLLKLIEAQNPDQGSSNQT